ncbi:cupin domain-containing protein [Flavicella marina]|uniref:cupin n=1 Tax=Flavicella marina TaxID=1475951 RepID=UPI0012654616|nr:cupin [Flavicella marina]
MVITSFDANSEFQDKITTKVILETSFSKEIRILLKKGQFMKEHKTKFPIIVHVLEGCIDFGVNGTIHKFEKGAIIGLDANIPHDLLANKNSIVRLTLSKQDSVERVEHVIS